MDEEFSENFKDRYALRVKEVNLINRLIDSGSDFAINGMSGSGKTRMIRDIIEEKRPPHLKINCLQCTGKKTLIQTLADGLCKKFNEKSKPISKMRLLIEKIRMIDSKLEDLEFEVDGYSAYSFRNSPQSFYILLDNCEKLNLTPKLFTQLIGLKSLLSINMSFIFCGIAFSPSLKLENPALELLPTIVLSPMSDADLIKIAYLHLSKKLQGYEQQCFIAFGKNFLFDLVQNFKILTKSATTINSLALRLFKIFIYSLAALKQPPQPQPKDFSSLIKSQTYILARKMLLQDPYLNEGDDKIFMEKIIQNRYDSDSFNLVNTYQIAKLPFFAGVILFCCWIGNRNSEIADKKLFKDYKGKMGKQQGRKTNNNKSDNGILKPIKLDRLVALSQSIISQSEWLSKLQEQQDLGECYEVSTYDQTTDFYSQIGMLIDMKYMQIVSNEHELSKAQFVCSLDEQSIKYIDSIYSLRLSDFFLKRE